MGGKKDVSEPVAGQAGRGGRKAAAAAAIAILLLAAAAYALHLMPGPQPGGNADLTKCGKAMGLISTALVRWSASKEPGAAYPDSLEDLSAAGFLERGPLSCPLGGRYVIEAGMSPDMPLGAVLVWEDGAAHRVEIEGRANRLVVHYVSCTARLHAFIQEIGPDGEEKAAGRLRARIDSLLSRQRRGGDLLKRARLDAAGTREEAAAVLRRGADPVECAFAACAAGYAGWGDLAPELAALASSGPMEPAEPHFSAAMALSRFGKPGGEKVLAAALGAEDYQVRKAAFEALRKAAGEDFGYAPFLPSGELAAAAARWAEWAGRAGR